MALTCFIVDDEMHGIHLIQDYLIENRSLKILGTSTDPRKALELIKQLEPDIVFTDINMPFMSGIELASFIDNLSVVVFISADRAYSHPEIDLKKNIYLTKPLRKQRLMDAIQEIQTRLKSN